MPLCGETCFPLSVVKETTDSEGVNYSPFLIIHKNLLKCVINELFDVYLKKNCVIMVIIQNIVNNVLDNYSSVSTMVNNMTGILTFFILIYQLLLKKLI